MQDWLVIIGVLLLLIMILNGFRHRQNTQRKRPLLARLFVYMMHRLLRMVRGSPTPIREREPSLGAMKAPNLSNNSDVLNENTLTTAIPAPQEQPKSAVVHNRLNESDSTQTTPTEPNAAPASKSNGLASSDDDVFDNDVQELIVLHVLANQSSGFKGPELVTLLTQLGCKFHTRKTFYLLDENGHLLFHVANTVEPGIFDTQSIQTFTTPGVSFFLCLPSKSSAIMAFDRMLTMAKSLAETLNATVKDDRYSVATEQTFSHYRQRISDFQRQWIMKTKQK